ncbi:centrosomal protein of 63 kDa isoform X13 [Caretta caretta]|uniref:centrosomal protein of 63 kDa isoform X13 n=1 Tax=Caretta caretta TaxID=8467 RepID=UPI0020957062|nr:centrosomal protein of 63 kDa isoform X13 [Caretta caretta]
MEALLERMQRQGHGGRGFLTSCEAELQELMKQIDIMVAHKKSEWEGQTQALETCLEIRDQELSSVRTLLDEKHKEVGRLRQQLEHTEQVQQGMVVEYEQQLKKFQEELGRLKRSYEKLQKKQLKEAREGPKSHGDDRSEVSRLTKKIEEFRQKALDWEKQRLLYQQQVASLEAQRKALTEQSELMQQTQLTNRKQMLESVQLASQSEIQHLTSKLERANDTICANELEVERLNMRVDDLTGANQKILEDHQRVQEELGHSKKMLEVLQEEKLELRVTLQSQEDFIKSSKMHQEQLHKELASVTETLHSKELLTRSLEEHLREKWLSQEFPELEHVLLQLDLAQKNEKNLQSEVARLEGSLGVINARCIQLSKELTEKCKELRVTEEHHCLAKAEIKKAKDVHVTDIQESYTTALNKLESENQQLQKNLAETRAKLELSTQVCRDKYESIVQQMQSKVTEIKDTECRFMRSVLLSRRTQELQHKHEEEKRKLQARLEKTIQHYKGEIQNLKAHHVLPGMGAVSDASGGSNPHVSRSSSKESLSSDSLPGTDPLSPVLDGKQDFTDDTSRKSVSSQRRELVPLCPLPTAPIGSIAARFLEEEEVRSQRILERLDAHIEELKRESERTVKQFTHQK